MVRRFLPLPCRPMVSGLYNFMEKILNTIYTAFLLALLIVLLALFVIMIQKFTWSPKDVEGTEFELKKGNPTLPVKPAWPDYQGKG